MKAKSMRFIAVVLFAFLSQGAALAGSVSPAEVTATMKTSDGKPISGVKFSGFFVVKKITFWDGKDFLPLPSFPHKDFTSIGPVVIGTTNERGEIVLRNPKFKYSGDFVNFAFGEGGLNFCPTVGLGLHSGLVENPQMQCRAQFDTVESMNGQSIHLDCVSEMSEAQLEAAIAERRKACE